MKAVSSIEYKQEGIRANELLRDRKLDAESRKALKIKKQCAEVLKKVESATGITFDVVTEKDAGSRNMAACVDFGLNRAFISENTLAANDNGWAIYAGRHEQEHLLSRIKALDIKKELSEDHQSELVQALMQSDLDLDAMEGFNDLSTIKKHGKNKRSGYLKKEVPFAEKLEKLCKQETGHSLLELYRKGNAPLLIYRVRQLADRLLCKKAFNELKEEKGTIATWSKLSDLEKRLRQEPPAVTTLAQAREAVAKLFAEQNEIDTIRTKCAA